MGMTETYHEKLPERPANESPSGQLGLFAKPATRPPGVPDRAPLARVGDPASSRLAAAEITTIGVRSAQKRALIEWLRTQTEALTSAEIAAHTGWCRFGVARRLPDAERDGLVGRYPMRVCGVNP